MSTDHRAELARIKRFDQLVAYLRDEMGWPIARDSFEDEDDWFFDFTADELGIDPTTAAKIEEIKRLRPLVPQQPWGVFFIKFEPKKLPVVALRRILSRVAIKKRASANSAERAAWAADDLLFVSNYGEGDERQISFAHFSQAESKDDLPTLKVLGWNNLDTPLHLDDVAENLTRNLAWPVDDTDIEGWRTTWSAAFTLRHREVITTSRDLSIRLAQLARDIRDRINSALAIETEGGPLTKLMKAFQEALVHDLDADGFADMYAQTIAYGLLSARIANPTGVTADHLPISMPVTNPFLKELMETFLHVGGRQSTAGDGAGIDFDELGASEVVQLLDHAKMEAVVLDFGDKNPLEDPVIHFYELFLKEYDAKKRMQRGVFYTPRPVVSYIVRSVHHWLQTELSLSDGLADTASWGEMAESHDGLTIPDGAKSTDRFVTILDPATGTGTFLVEVIEVIHSTLVSKWEIAGHGEKEILDLWNAYVEEQLLPRLHGYELMMAPYAIAHLKIGLKLLETGYRFRSDERARIYLTNALEPAHDFSGQFEFAIPALAHEAQSVNEIKRRERFTVVIGNPPYAKVSSNMGSWAQDLVKASSIDGIDLPSYYEVSGVGLGERKVNLQDDYIKFLRLAQYLGVRSNACVLGLITNRGYLAGPTFRGMRQSLLSSFGLIAVTDLHGDSNVGEQPPHGRGNDNVFDIQQGVCVSLMARVPWGSKAELRFTDVWGTRGEKYDWLSATRVATEPSPRSIPQPPYFLFTPSELAGGDEYQRWCSLVEVFPASASGIVTSRDGFVIGVTDREIHDRVKVFLDPTLSDDEVAHALGLTENYVWRISEARRELGQDEEWPDCFDDILYRPFDVRRILYHRAVVWRTREPLMKEMSGGENLGLIATRQGLDKYSHVFVTRWMTEYKAGSHHRNSQVFPLFIGRKPQESLIDSSAGSINISESWLERLASETAGDGSVGELREPGAAEEVLGYVYAVLHSPSYRRRYAEMLKMDFPRIPLPTSGDLYRSLARLGGEIVTLHLLESSELNGFGTSFTGTEKPEVGRVGWSEGTVWLDAGAAKTGQPPRPGTLGFQGVPEEVWDFHIGGYQVCHKWLKDRKGRTLSEDDIAHYQKVVVAISETIRLMSEIDSVIEEHGGWPGAFSSVRPTQG